MEFKIFKAGVFTEKEINEFMSTHIILKMQFPFSGDIYFFFKQPYALGKTPIEKIEELDRFVTQAESTIAAHTMSMDDANTKMADLKEEINKYGPNEKEWKTLSEKIDIEKNKVLMAQETIDECTRSILNSKQTVQDLLNLPRVDARKSQSDPAEEVKA
jgi:flagellar biosynthesis chaperone FliJ